MYVAQVMDLINALEREYPVDEWRVGDVLVWPLARHALIDALEDVSVAISSGKRESSRVRAWADRLATDIAGRVTASVRDPRHQASLPTKRGALLLSDGVSRTRFDGAWYEEFLEPLIPGFRACQLEPVILEYHGTVAIPRHAPSRLVQLEFDALTALAATRRRQLIRDAHLPGIGAVHAELRRRSLPDTALAEVGLVRRAAAVEAIAGFLEKLLRKAHAEVALAGNMGLYAMALHLAARRAEVPSVDLQHGAQSDIHWAYARWLRVPAAGYALLPRVYWVWRETEAATIRAWAGDNGPHRAIVGGNRWLEVWRSDGSTETREPLAQAAAVRRRLGSGINVLVTFQTGATRPLLDLVDAAIARAPQDWGWWIRNRLTMGPEELTVLARRFGDRHNVEHDLASGLPLHAVLSTVDAHLTAFSTSVVEAEAFGVPSVVTDPLGMEIFPELTSRGWVVEATDAATIVEAIATQVKRRALLSRLWTPPPGDAAEVIREVLALGAYRGAASTPR